MVVVWVANGYSVWFWEKGYGFDLFCLSLFVFGFSLLFLHTAL